MSTGVPSAKSGCSKIPPTKCSRELWGASSPSAGGSAPGGGASAPAARGARRISSRSGPSSRRSITSQPELAPAGHSGISGMAAPSASARARACSAAACRSAAFFALAPFAAASSAAVASASAAALAAFCSSVGSTFTDRPRSLQKPSVICAKKATTLSGYLVWIARRVSACSRYWPSQTWRWSKACSFSLSRSSWCTASSISSWSLTILRSFSSFSSLFSCTQSSTSPL
mmetsp:Transcript_78608/g.206323  ORF Transcript_78608/g.206323 Transcript_78608/m.206323 type:complete len:230 (+) Transcript_78608:611-1300(+)